MRNKFLSRLFIILAAAFGLAACGSPSASSWPGLATDGQLAYVAYNQQVHAIGLADGKEVWAFPAAPSATTGVFFADPGISPKMIVVGSEGPTASHSGILFGLNPQTGQQQWCLAFDSRGAKRQSCPLASDAILPIVIVPGLFEIEPPSDNRVLGGITIADDTAYFGLANSRVYAVDLVTGKDKWAFKAEHAIWAAPRVEGEVVYVAALDHFVYALNRADGSLKWKKDLGAAVGGTPTVVDGNLYVGSFGSKLYALDTATGGEKWPAPFQAHNWVWGGPVFQTGMLYFTDLAGTVFAVDAESGSQKWAVTPGQVMRASPAVSADTVLVGDKAGMLFALNSADGAVRWKQQLSKGELLTTPLVSNDLVLVTPHQGDNLVVAYTLASGALKWAFAPSKK
jgi:outer membrane protein assembly factor BamB